VCIWLWAASALDPCCFPNKLIDWALFYSVHARNMLVQFLNGCYSIYNSCDKAWESIQLLVVECSAADSYRCPTVATSSCVNCFPMASPFITLVCCVRTATSLSAILPKVSCASLFARLHWLGVSIYRHTLLSSRYWQVYSGCLLIIIIIIIIITFFITIVDKLLQWWVGFITYCSVIWTWRKQTFIWECHT